MAVLAMLGAACSAPAPTGTSDGPWRGTTQREQGRRVVNNLSGSLWEGPVSLSEEASIGAESGPVEYLLGTVGGVWATEDRIFVVDRQVPTVRVYDGSGGFLHNVGRPGQGPGEYEEPLSVAVAPNGDIVVAEVGGGRVNVYDSSGSPLHTYRSSSAERTITPRMFLLSLSGTPFMKVRLPGADGVVRTGMASVGTAEASPIELVAPSLGYAPECLSVEFTSDPLCDFPFGPAEITALTPTLDWVVGVSDTYAFEVHSPTGEVTRVSKYWTPVPVSERERTDARSGIEFMIRQNEPGWSWNGPPIATNKPAYVSFLPDRDGRIWVMGEGPSRATGDPCGSPDRTLLGQRNACWEATMFLDGFNADGQFLGRVSLPGGILEGADVFIRGDTLVVPVMDAAGTIFVKRYRLRRP